MISKWKEKEICKLLEAKPSRKIEGAKESRIEWTITFELSKVAEDPDLFFDAILSKAKEALEAWETDLRFLVNCQSFFEWKNYLSGTKSNSLIN